jgi:hypothetical protein
MIEIAFAGFFEGEVRGIFAVMILLEKQDTIAE